METQIAPKTITVKPYLEYKNSGEAWIAEIPKHWEIKKLKLIFSEKNLKTNPELNCGSISYGKVVVKNDEKIPFSTKASYQEVLNGEFLINPLNLNYDLISLRIALSYIEVVVSSGYIVLNAIINMDKEYFKYLLHRYDVAYMKLLGSGVRQTINFNHISNSLLPFPPIEEQTAIGQFLNSKTFLIDQAIGIKERQIELLKERRQILIHNTVTRGLDPDVKMKDSGVEWIGEIPEHWEAKRLKHFSSVQSGVTLGKSYLQKNLKSYPYLRVANVQLGYFKLDDIAQISLPESDAKKYFVRVGDILVTEGGDLDKLGRGTVWAGEIVDCLHQNHVFAIRVNKTVTIPEFVSFALESDYCRRYFTTTANKTTNLASTNSTKLGNIPIMLPPIAEQSDILSHINTVSGKINAAILLKEKEIEKLKEYKATLINSAVTGKIKVTA